MSSTIRVRFAPSPTGYFHVGGARTALFNWLYARQNGGKFILRIEDTDLERSTEEAVNTILEGMKWLGLNWDEGPYYQTHNLALHKAAAEQLLTSGAAYKAYETKEELDEKRKAAEAAKTPFRYDGAHRGLTPDQQASYEAEGRPYVVRFRVPQDGGSVLFKDLVYGPQEKMHADIEDFVLLRSDGAPLYLLSNAVDDIQQNITHIIRGQDGLANTPKQILIYQALGKPVPSFAHLPLILSPQREKLSKRKHGEVASVHYYRERGFIPEAFLNFLALLGWSPGNDQEIMSLQEMQKLFSFERTSHTNAIFNLGTDADERNWTDPKALWMNSEYLKMMPLEELLPLVQLRLEEAGLYNSDSIDFAWFSQTVDLLRARFRVLTDFITLGKPYFSDDFDFEPEAVKKNLKDPALRELLPLLAERLNLLEKFSPELIETTLRALAEEQKVKAGLLINATRTALTGQSVGPSLFELVVIIGQKRTYERLHLAISKIQSN